MLKNPVVRKRVGRNVRQVRELRGYSQDQLAERAKNTQKHIGLIERGEANLTLDYLASIAQQLSVDPSQLLKTRKIAEQHRVYIIGEPELQELERAVEHLLDVIRRVRRAQF
jgi:transcriptional regulator with XRE-family HTH domain